MQIQFMFLIFVLFISASYSSKEVRNFLIEFLKASKNEKILENISNQCVGKIFDYNLLLLKKSYKENNITSLYKNLENLALDMLINCPTNDLISIFKQTEFGIISSLGFKYKSKIYTKVLTLGSSLFLSYKNNTLTLKSLGEAFGKTLNLIKFDYSELYDLISEDDDDPEIESLVDKANSKIIELIEGIFIGMKDPEEKSRENKCYNDIIKGKKKINNYIEKALKDMEEGKSFKDVKKSLGFNLVTVEGLAIDCKLLSLGNSNISKLTSFKEVKNIIFKMMKAKKYFFYMKQIIGKIKNKKIKDAGRHIGKILSDILEFNIK